MNIGNRKKCVQMLQLQIIVKDAFPITTLQLMYSSFSAPLLTQKWHLTPNKDHKRNYSSIKLGWNVQYISFCVKCMTLTPISTIRGIQNKQRKIQSKITERWDLTRQQSRNFLLVQCNKCNEGLYSASSASGSPQRNSVLEIYRLW